MLGTFFFGCLVIRSWDQNGSDSDTQFNPINGVSIR